MSLVIRTAAILMAAVLLFGCRGADPAPLPGSPERQRLISELLARIPPGAPLSIQSNLIAHLGPKGRPYLFPVVADAEYVLTDVAASADPVVAGGMQQKVQELLDSGQFGVVDAAGGLALLKRGVSGQSTLPDRFYDFLRAKPEQTAFPANVRFGDDLEMVALDYEMTEGELTRVATYWRALRPLDLDHTLVFFLTPAVGGQPEPLEDGSLAALWYPPGRWQSGEVIEVEFAPALFSRDTTLVQVIAYQQRQEGRVPLTPRLASGEASETAFPLLNLAEPPTERVPLADFIGQPFESIVPASQARTDPADSGRPPPAPPDSQQPVSLCGKRLDDISLASLRPVAIKIDNASAARPQSGLDAACIVYEHVTEAGITRFTAIYQTEDTVVGPVRSARRVDLHIIPQYQAFFGHVGGAPAEMEAIRRAGLLDVDQFFHSGAYSRVRQKPAPHNVYTSVSAIRSAGERLGYGREAELEGFVFADSAPEKGTPAEQIILPYRTSSRAEFQYDAEAGDYVRYTGGQPHVDAATGRVVRATTIIVQQAPSWVVSFTEDAGGAASYEFDLLGEGGATVFRDGKAIEGKWVRPTLEDWTHFYDEDGDLAPLAPGKIWISIISPNENVIIR